MEHYADLLADELNVKRVRALGSAGEVVSYQLNPLPKQLGQKYKHQFPAVRAALLALDPTEAGQALLNGEAVEVSVDGETFAIQPDEVEVRAEAHAGLAVASEGAYLAALKTELTPKLVREGLAREFVRRVQDLRKQADFDIADRIHLYASASPELAAAIEAHREYIKAETLALKLRSSTPPSSATTASFEFDGERVEVGIVKAS